MTAWRCPSCHTPNAQSAPRCRKCKRRAGGPLTLGDLVDRALRDFDRHRAELQRYGVKRERKE